MGYCILHAVTCFNHPHDLKKSNTKPEAASSLMIDLRKEEIKYFLLNVFQHKIPYPRERIIRAGRRGE